MVNTFNWLRGFSFLSLYLAVFTLCPHCHSIMVLVIDTDCIKHHIPLGLPEVLRILQIRGRGWIFIHWHSLIVLIDYILSEMKVETLYFTRKWQHLFTFTKGHRARFTVEKSMRVDFVLRFNPRFFPPFSLLFSFLFLVHFYRVCILVALVWYSLSADPDTG